MSVRSQPFPSSLASALAAIVAGLHMASGAAVPYPVVDEAEVLRILSQMTLQEKYNELCIPVWTDGDPPWTADLTQLLHIPNFIYDLPQGNERLKLRSLITRDGPKGPTCALGDNLIFERPCGAGGKSPAFPAESLRAATWNTELEEEVGQAMGDASKDLDVHLLFAPSINILPWLNWGRGQESYGEDPLFNGKMGAALVRGIQSRGVMATAKHFLANNIENSRFFVNAVFNNKTLHEVYLKAWAVVVAESAPEFVMTSYNRVQGHWANQDPRFLDILRNRLGFEGSVTTDWGATWEMVMGWRAESPGYGKPRGWYGNDTTVLTAGVDLEMPWCNFDARAVRTLGKCGFQSDAEACQASNVLDRAVAHLIRSKFRFGLAGEGSSKRAEAEPIFERLQRAFIQRDFKDDAHAAKFDEHRYDQLILKVAQQGMVLLENKGGFLPKALDDASSKVAVLGTPGELELGDKGSSAGRPSGEVVTVLDGLRERYGASKVIHIQDLSEKADDLLRAASMVVLDVGLTYKEEGEYIPDIWGGDRQTLSLKPDDIQLIHRVSKLNANVVVAITSGQVITVEEFVDEVKAIVWMGYPGPMGGRALAQILTGDVNPSGRMTSVTPRRAEDYVPEGITLKPWAAGADVVYPYAHGFKHMWASGAQPRYPLGWGLSYTTFTHEAPTLGTEGEGPLPALILRTAVSNTGGLAGSEVVQVYATCPSCRQLRLPILLVGFARVSLERGAKQAVEVRFSARDLAIYNEDRGLWFLEKAEYIIHSGPRADAEALKTVSFVAPADHEFDYVGPKGKPDIPGAGARECSRFQCKPDEDFLKHQSDLARQKGALWLVVIGALLLASLMCCCCLRRCCCPGCCRGHKAEKVKQS